MNAANHSECHLIFQMKDKVCDFPNWSLKGSVRRAYDKAIKGYCLVGDMNSKLIMPKDPRNDCLKFQQPFIVLQCKILDKRTFGLEIVFTGNDDVRRRLIFAGSHPYSYSQHNISKGSSYIRVPVGFIQEGIWQNV